MNAPDGDWVSFFTSRRWPTAEKVNPSIVMAVLAVPVKVAPTPELPLAYARPDVSPAAVVAAVTEVSGFTAATAAVTNAVVANWVVLVLTAAVGAAGVPVNVGDANGATVDGLSENFV